MRNSRGVILCRTAAVVAAALAAAGGCQRGPRQENVASLKGTIAIDGERVKKGGIQFMPVEKGRPAFSEVKDGAYTATVPMGRVRVVFSSVKETGRHVQVYSSKVPEVIDSLPPALREGIEITVQGDATRNFDLSSKGKER